MAELRIELTETQLAYIEKEAKRRGVSASELALFLLGMAFLRDAANKPPNSNHSKGTPFHERLRGV